MSRVDARGWVFSPGPSQTSRSHPQRFGNRITSPDRAELTPAEVASLTCGSPDDPCWSSGREAILIRMVDALHDSCDVDDELWRSAQELFDEQQLLDLPLLCGWYHAICFAARTARVELEPGAPRFVDVTAA